MIDYGEQKCQNRGGDNVVTHYRVDKRAADESRCKQKKCVEACARGINVPQCTCQKTQNHAVCITFIHCDAHNKGYKKQSPDAENLRKEAVCVLQNGYQQQYQSKAEPAEYQIFLLRF